eukprot:913502-Amphidinium_carterae.1
MLRPGMIATTTTTVNGNDNKSIHIGTDSCTPIPNPLVPTCYHSAAARGWPEVMSGWGSWWLKALSAQGYAYAQRLEAVGRVLHMSHKPHIVKPRTSQNPK